MTGNTDETNRLLQQAAEGDRRGLGTLLAQHRGPVSLLRRLPTRTPILVRALNALFSTIFITISCVCPIMHSTGQPEASSFNPTSILEGTALLAPAFLLTVPIDEAQYAIWIGRSPWVLFG